MIITAREVPKGGQIMFPSESKPFGDGRWRRVTSVHVGKVHTLVQLEGEDERRALPNDFALRLRGWI